MFRQAIPATKQGFYPDAISTDLHIGSMNCGMMDILNVMSKFLNIGMSLQDVVKANTSRAAEVIKRTELGHLGPPPPPGEWGEDPSGKKSEGGGGSATLRIFNRSLAQVFLKTMV